VAFGSSQIMLRRKSYPSAYLDLQSPTHQQSISQHETQTQTLGRAIAGASPHHPHSPSILKLHIQCKVPMLIRGPQLPSRLDACRLQCTISYVPKRNAQVLASSVIPSRLTSKSQNRQDARSLLSCNYVQSRRKDRERGAKVRRQCVDSRRMQFWLTRVNT
jgi:hypothetical protein